MAWLYTQGHEVVDFSLGRGLTTSIGGKEYKFCFTDEYGGYKVGYSQGVFTFYNGDKLLKETNLNEFS